MPLVIELDYLHGAAPQYNWIEPFVNNDLQNQFGIPVQLYINPQSLPSNLVGDNTNDSELQNFLAYWLPQSVIRQNALAAGDWYIHLLLASYHNASILGEMYDATNMINSRKGCAVFMSQLIDLSKQDGVPINDIIGRTILHEIGHCMALLHNTDGTVMSETSVLQQSPIPPGWWQNINYNFNPADINFVRSNPAVARPGGRMVTGPIADEYLSSRNISGLAIELLNFDLEPKLLFETGDVISICLELRYNGKRSIRLPYPLHQSSKHIIVTLTKPGGETVRLQLQKGCGAGMGSKLMKSGEKCYVSLNLFFDYSGYMFSDPGTYRIECFVRTFGKNGGWISSGLKELIMQPASVEQQDWMRRLYAGKRQNKILGGSKALFTASTLKDIQKTQTEQPRIAVPLSWMAVSHYKNVIALSDDSKMIKIAIRELLRLYTFLGKHESFVVRRGKILSDLQNLRAQTGQLTESISEKETAVYDQIKSLFINRSLRSRNNENYEKKILAI
jgi:hypothetical protein